MKHNYSKHSTNLAFLDMLFNMVLAFAFLFVLAFLLINPPTVRKPAVELKAEYIIQVDWPDEAYEDIDTWLLLPNGKRVGFGSKDVDYVTLDRDDRGISGDTFLNPVTGEIEVVKLNREMMVIRARVPGRYVVNLHVYALHKNHLPQPPKIELPYAVSVTLIKVNPLVTEIIKKPILMSKLNQEATAFAFDIKDDGSISIDNDADVPFIGFSNIVRSQ
ncbi:MAG: hypothetical protein N2235_08460 [Fischerella sp.]|nr:hypothetical protein [Fischerella sp.]